MADRRAPRYLLFDRRPLASARLYCFPFAGGSAAAYRSWARAVPSTHELAACQLPGRHDRYGEAHPVDVEALADLLADDLVAEHDGRPFALFGHSFGALIAFLVARRLSERGAPLPSSLGLSGRSAPQHTGTLALSALDDNELVRVLSSWGGIPPEVKAHPDMLALVLGPLRKDLMLSDEYVPTPSDPLPVTPVHVFSGRDDALILPGTLETWGEHFQHPIRIHSFPGGHFYIWDEGDYILRCLCEPAPVPDTSSPGDIP